MFISLDEDAHHKGCSVLIDLMTFPVSEEKECLETLSIKAEHLRFIKQPRLLPDLHEGYYTTILYHKKAIRMYGAIAPSLSDIKRFSLSGVPWYTIEDPYIDLTDAYNFCVFGKFLSDYDRLSPASVITTYTTWTDKPNERILIHRDHPLKKCYLEYKYVNGGDTYALLSRVKYLLQMSDAFSIGNHTLRSLFSS